MRKDAGFTLLELMIVIGLIAILAGIALPNIISWLPDYRLRNAARQLQSTVELARLRAVKENAPVVIQFNTLNDSYTAFVDNGAGNTGNWVRDADEAIVKNGSLPAGADMYNTTFGAARVGFNGRGIPSTAGSVYVRNDQNGYMGISLNNAGNSRIIKSTDEGSTWQ
jgi:type IV fimbrial biogenesis protein FimT